MGNVITANGLYEAKLGNLLKMAKLAAVVTPVQEDGTCMLVLVDITTGRVYRKLDAFLTHEAYQAGQTVTDGGTGLSIRLLGPQAIVQYSTFHLVNQLLELLTTKIYY